MPPIRDYHNWNKRKSDQSEQIEPYQKFFFICEGANTEVFYFKKLIDLRKQLGIHPLISLHLLEKTGKDRNISNPKRLLKYAEEIKEQDDISFDKERDSMIVVIDADIYENDQEAYFKLLENAKQAGNLLAVSNPAFELFLLLHYKDSYETDIKPNETEIIANRKINNRRFIDKLFTTKSGINSKKNEAVGNLAENIDIAIEQERKLNQDINKCQGKLTCNIGKIISDIKKINLKN